MCGICGFNFENKALISSMNGCISHRGPDAKGYFLDKNLSLGHRRLSIIDLSKRGSQPMFNEDGTIALVYNGEIFNFKDFKSELEEKGHKFNSDTDTEAVIHAYEEYGTGCLRRFNGFFAFALYDMKKKLLFIPRDRLGIKPLYYYFDGRKFLFASEIKSILQDKTIRRELNIGALNQYFMLRFIHSEETIFRNIYRLKPGHYILFDLKSCSLTIKKYWDVAVSEKKESEEACIRNILGLFEDSVLKRQMSDVPLGVYLSGGIDSSAVVAMMSKLGIKDINTYSVGFQHDEIGNELKYAKSVSELFGTRHREFMIKPDIVRELPRIVWHMDEPIADPAFVPEYFLSKEAAKTVKVILAGDGADELFAGYDQYKFMALGNRISFLPRGVRKNIVPLVRLLPEEVINKIYKYSTATGTKIYDRLGKFLSCIKEDRAKAYLEVFSVFDEEEKKQLLNPDFLDKGSIYREANSNYFNSKSNFLNQLLYHDLKTYLPEDLLMKPDKMCMAYGIEARVPFLDYRMVEYAFTLPAGMKLKGNTSKYIMKKAFGRILPKDILHRKKQPFQVPLDQWLSKELKSYFGDLLDDPINNQFFSRRHIRKIFDSYNNSKLFYGRQIWSLGIFNVWYKEYMEDSASLLS